MLKKLIHRILPKRIKREREGAKLARKATYFQDGICTIHNCDFVNDPKFSAAYSAGEQTGSWGNSKIHWRAMVACWAANIGRRLEGDFVECGVNKGGLARTVMEYAEVHKSGKTFWLVDTYEGLVDRFLSDSERKRGFNDIRYEPCYAHVQRIFSQYGECARIIKGAVPDVLNQVTPEKVAYLSIDMNCVQPEIAAATLFWPKMSSGAVIVLDDYGWHNHIDQKHAFDRFAQERDVMVLPLPTGQGIIIKP